MLAINKNNLLYMGLVICVFSAFFMLQLRFDGESDLSLYRIIFPLHILMLIAFSPILIKHYVVFALALALTSILSIYFGRYEFSSLNIVYYFHYLTVFTFFITGYLFYNKDKSKLDKIFCLMLFLIFVSSCVEFFWGYRMPNVLEREGVIRSFFTNENDLSLVLLSISLYLYFFMEERTVFYFSFFLATLVSYINSSDVCLFGCVLLPFLKPLMSVGRNYKSTVFFTLALIIIFIIMILLYASEESVLYKIISLDSYGYYQTAGSVKTRANLMIWGLKAFFDSNLLGIGVGNSLVMIENNTYGSFIAAAKSLHNFPVQILSELGVIFLIPFFVCFFKMSPERKVFIFYVSFISLSQSVGIFSNIVFFMVVGAFFGAGYHIKNIGSAVPNP